MASPTEKEFDDLSLPPPLTIKGRGRNVDRDLDEGQAELARDFTTPLLDPSGRDDSGVGSRQTASTPAVIEQQRVPRLAQEFSAISDIEGIAGITTDDLTVQFGPVGESRDSHGAGARPKTSQPLPTTAKGILKDMDETVEQLTQYLDGLGSGDGKAMVRERLRAEAAIMEESRGTQGREREVSHHQEHLGERSNYMGTGRREPRPGTPAPNAPITAHVRARTSQLDHEGMDYAEGTYMSDLRGRGPRAPKLAPPDLTAQSSRPCMDSHVQTPVTHAGRRVGRRWPSFAGDGSYGVGAAARLGGESRGLDGQEPSYLDGAGSGSFRDPTWGGIAGLGIGQQGGELHPPSCADRVDRSSRHAPMSFGAGGGGQTLAHQSGDSMINNTSMDGARRHAFPTHGGGDQYLPRIKNPPTFDGREPLDLWLTQFELICEINGWTDRQSAMMAAVALRGQALTVLSVLTPQERSCYQSLRAALCARFDPANRRQMHQTNLQSRVRRPGESLMELATDIKRLVARAHPRADAVTLDDLARTAFLRAVGDRDMIREIIRCKTTSMDETVKEALEYECNEAWLKREEQRGKYKGDGLMTFDDNETEKVSPNEQPRQPQTHREPEQRRDNGMTNRTRQWTPSNRDRQHQNGCHICGDMRHWKKDCPYRREYFRERNNRFGGPPRRWEDRQYPSHRPGQMNTNTPINNNNNQGNGPRS